MDIQGGCYCGAIRYVATGEPISRGMCFCRECQHVASAGPNVVLAMPAAGFRYTMGEPARFARSDLAAPATREFCPTCGTQLLTLSPRAVGAVLIKAGTLDDPSLVGMPQFAIHTAEKQPYHVVPEGVTAFAALPPGRG